MGTQEVPGGVPRRRAVMAGACGEARAGKVPRVKCAMPSEIVIFVCATCKREGETADTPRAGAVLAEAMASAGGPHRVQPVSCLANCARGPSVALVRPDGWTYVFGRLEAEGTPAAMQEGATLLAGSADGQMPWKGRPEMLKRNMIARIPPFHFAPAPAPPVLEGAA